MHLLRRHAGLRCGDNNRCRGVSHGDDGAYDHDHGCRNHDGCADDHNDYTSDDDHSGSDHNNRSSDDDDRGGPYVVGAPDLYPLMALPGSAGAAGSGCAPGAGPLPDGVWFGIVSVIGATSVDFDLACFYFGDIAYTKGAEDGQEVNNDYYIRNMNPTLRTVPVAAGATVHELAPGYTGFVTEPYAAWPADTTMSMVCPSSGCLVWVFVNGGVATEILEQFTP